MTQYLEGAGDKAIAVVTLQSLVAKGLVGRAQIPKDHLVRT